MAFLHREVLYAPRFAIHRLYARIVCGNDPIGTNHTIKAIFLSQQVGDDIPTKTICHILARRVNTVGDGIVRHDSRGRARRSIQLQCPLRKGQEMLFEVITWIYTILSEAVVRIPSRFACAAARPVLSHAVHTLITPSCRTTRCCLKGVGISARNIGTEVGIFGESAIEASPTRVSGEVYLRRERGGDTQGSILYGGYLRMTADNVHIKRRRQTYLAWPLRYVAT